MLIFRDLGVAYVHVPKTAGRAMRRALVGAAGPAEEWWGIERPEPWSPEERRFEFVDMAHYTAEMLQTLRPAVWEELLGMRVFSVVRDPYRRAASAYRQFLGFRRRSPSLSSVGSLKDYLRCVGDELYRTDRLGHLFIHGAPQVRFHMPGHVLLCGDGVGPGLTELFGGEVPFVWGETPCRGLSRSEMLMVERVYGDDLALWESLGGSTKKAGRHHF